MRELINFICWLGMVICWFNAVIYDISNNNAVWAVLDFLIAPFGVIRGLILFFN